MSQKNIEALTDLCYQNRLVLSKNKKYSVVTYSRKRKPISFSYAVDNIELARRLIRGSSNTQFKIHLQRTHGIVSKW